jgi:hypothetical protein
MAKTRQKKRLQTTAEQLRLRRRGLATHLEASAPASQMVISVQPVAKEETEAAQLA